jgi:hypothetical protein
MGGKRVSSWHGDELVDRVEHAARAELNETVDAARDDARHAHAWRRDPRLRRLRKGGPLVNPDLERQIVSAHAEPDGPLVAAFGFTRREGFYGLFHEESTVHEHLFPAIRPAADRQFPGFLERLRRRLQ